MADRGLCLEEYLDLLRQYSKDAPLSVTDDGRAYQVYFCPENDPLATLIRSPATMWMVFLSHFSHSSLFLLDVPHSFR